MLYMDDLLCGADSETSACCMACIDTYRLLRGEELLYPYFSDIKRRK